MKEKNFGLHNLLGIAAIGAILILSVLISGCIDTGGGKEKVKSDSVVKINFTDDNNITTEKYIFIGEKKYSFENDLIGMKIGDEKKFICEDVVSVRLQHEPEVGKIYSTPMGEIKIFKVNESGIYLGHKLTGETLTFNVKVKEIKDVVTERISCLENHNVSIGTVAFYHASWCPHCQKMKPWVKELENEGYKFLWAQIDSQESTMVANVKIAQECYKDVINFGGGIPQFGCAANGQLHIGEFMSKEEMKNFADECKKSGDLLKLENVNKTELKVSKGNSVTVEYIGKLNNGEIFDNGTITFIAGAGQMIPGFDEGIMGMKINESKLIVVPPEKGYGTIDQLTPIPREIPEDIPLATFKQIFKEEPSLNKEYNISNNPWPLKVIKINTKKYNCTVKILNISTKEEYANRSCLKTYGLADGTVAFYHASWCPHCQKMKPWVKELENEGYKFLWAQIDSQESTMVANVKIAQECYKDIINFGGGIPQFGCAANGQLHIGEFMSKEEMKNFADECKKAAEKK